jgi:hypothetical protein
LPYMGGTLSSCTVVVELGGVADSSSVGAPREHDAHLLGTDG